MRIRRHLGRFAAGLLAVGLLAGCGAATPEALTTPGTTATAPTATDSPAPEESEAPQERTVTDMAGREVTLPAQVETVGTFGSVGVLNAFVQLMGAGDRIVNNMPDRFTSTDQWAMQYEFSPQLAEGPLFEEGGEVMIEVVLEHQPDVSFVMSQETATILEDRDIPVVYLEWGDVDDVRTAVTLVGEVLGVEERAEEYLAYFDEQQAATAELVAGIPEDERVTVLYGDPIQFRQPHIIAEWWITQAGGISVTDDGREDNTLEYTMEDLLAWNPEVIILTNDRLREEIAASATHANIAAVQADAIHSIPTVAHVWGNRTVEQPLTVLWTMHKLYPEVMPREQLAQEIRDFYADFFLYDMSDEQIDGIIGS